MDKKKKDIGNLIKKNRESPNFFKYLILAITFLIIFILFIILIWEKYSENYGNSGLKTAKPVLVTQESLKLINEKLKALETKQQQPLRIPHQLIALELLKGALEGYISLDTLKSFLEKHSDPWTQDFFETLAPIKASSTYNQLESLFVIASPRTSTTPWKSIQEKIKSFISVRKLDKNEGKTDPLDDIHEAIRIHDIQKALVSFENLSSEQKAQLSKWKTLAQDRLSLEMLLKSLLLELSKG